MLGKPLVRFCEGLGSNRCMAEILWHHRETRWQQRIQTSACSIGSPQSTRKLVTSGSVGGMASNGCLYPEAVDALQLRY